jgi:hypothetical protein
MQHICLRHSLMFVYTGRRRNKDLLLLLLLLLLYLSCIVNEINKNRCKGI